MALNVTFKVSGTGGGTFSLDLESMGHQKKRPGFRALGLGFRVWFFPCFCWAGGGGGRGHVLTVLQVASRAFLRASRVFRAFKCWLTEGFYIGF